MSSEGILASTLIELTRQVRELVEELRAIRKDLGPQDALDEEDTQV